MAYQYNPEADIDKVRHELDLSFAFAEDVRRVYYALANNLGDLLDTKEKIHGGSHVVHYK